MRKYVRINREFTHPTIQVEPDIWIEGLRARYNFKTMTHKDQEYTRAP